MDLTGIQRSGNETRGWGVSQSLAFVNCMSRVILAGTHNWKRSRGFAVLMSFLWTRFIFSIPGENLLLFTLPIKANCSRLRWGGPSCRAWGIRVEENAEEKQLLLQSFIYKVQTLQNKENMHHSIYLHTGEVEGLRSMSMIWTVWKPTTLWKPTRREHVRTTSKNPGNVVP